MESVLVITTRFLYIAQHGFEPHKRLHATDLVAIAGLFVAYAILLGIGRATIDEGDPSAWPRWALAGATIAIALAAVGLMIRAGRRTNELDRFLFSESSSVGFFATMLAALTYGLLESVVAAPRLSAWAALMFGMSVWAVTTLALRRSMS